LKKRAKSVGLTCVFLLATVVQVKAQDVVAEPNLQLFTVMAAINAAGYDAGTSQPELAPMRAAVRRELAGVSIPSLPELKDFYERHRLFEPGRDLSQYISLALYLSPPPAFELQGSPANRPPEVTDLADMVPLISAFYEQAKIATLWQKYQPAMEQESIRYRKFLSRMILETNAYLRMDTSGYFNRRFAIYIDPLEAPNQVNARSYGVNYIIAVGPAAELPEEEIRHGWLHYLLDPYPYKYAKNVEPKASLQQITKRIPQLDDSFRNDFSLLLTESLIRAIQARRSSGAAQSKRQAADEAVQEGYFLTDYFFKALDTFEKQPVGMRLYYPEMIDGIQVKAEQARLAKVQFRAPSRPERHETVLPPTEAMMRQGEDSIARGQFEEARQTFETVNREFGPQARAIYGLAIVATQQKQPQAAKEYFTQAAAAADPHIKAWSHIYLGRILDLEGNRDQARAEYSAALAAGDSSPATRAAAEKGLQEGFAGKPKAENAQDVPSLEEKPRQGIPLGKDRSNE